MRVQEIMTRDVATVRPDTTVDEIARTMVRRGISGLPVVTPAGRIVGMVTELDLIARNARLDAPAFFRILDGWVALESPEHFQARLRHMLGTTAREVMSAMVVSVPPELELEGLVELMERQRVNPVPVVDGGRLVGIVSRTDIVRTMAREMEVSAA
jgi:CBS domain-containing protein